ncbi:1,4-dihydroxy-6-naphthoate synthase [uncultured Alistipes sp.]|uniref:1,4-dihydroxy-6-naphthoate synthase n=1 Tax=uncultured Alistipes sp. TaxID=538949 RepID=UPI0025D3C607|nr:1,4-dihydroxy-6-naphthoate synthase [uncultured Alistipes sp.]
MTLRLHISPCPNDTFMFDALINGRIDTEGLRFEVEYHDIEELNRGVQTGRADVSKISCAVLPAIAAHYTLLDSGAALGRGNGPLLVRRAGDTAPIRRIVVPGLHTTANALMQRLFPDITERTPLLFSDIAAAVERGDFDAGVLIHEGRFVYRERDLELVADLGQLWEQTTALPLPLGGIVAKNELPQAVRRQVERLLRQSIEHAFANPGASRAYIKEHAQELDDKVIDAHIALFVNEYSLSLGQEGRRAVEALTGYYFDNLTTL